MFIVKSNCVLWMIGLQLLESRPSFQKTNSPDEMIIQGWKKKFGLPDQVVETSKA
jgi:hypothetical protein